MEGSNGRLGFVGGIFSRGAGSALLTAILYGLCWRWKRSYAKAITLSVIVAALATFLSAIGNGESGSLDFRATPVYLLAQAIILALDLIRVRGKKAATLTKGTT